MATQILEYKIHFYTKLVDKIEDQYSVLYPNIVNQKDFIKSIIKDEEKGFLKTLNQGLVLINDIMESNLNDKIYKG